MAATTQSAAKRAAIEHRGADAAVMDGLNARAVGEVVAKAHRDRIGDPMTAIGGRRPDKAPGSVARGHQPAPHRGDRSSGDRGGRDAVMAAVSRLEEAALGTGGSSCGTAVCTGPAPPMGR